MKKRWVLRFFLFAALCAAALRLAPRLRGITAASILAHSPRSPLPAALFLLLLYAGKGLSFFFPLAVLEAAAGLLFPLRMALALNLCGVAAAMSLPWLFGKHGQDGLEAFLSRHPRLFRIRELRQGSDFLFVLLVRLTGIFPFDAVSFYLGASGIPYGTCLCAGLLGCLPHLIAVTVLGSALSDPASSTFFLSVSTNLAVTTAALTVWRIHKRKAA